MKSTRLALVSPLVLLLAACGSDDNTAAPADAAYVDGGTQTGVPNGGNDDLDATLGAVTVGTTTSSPDATTTTTTTMDSGMMAGDDDDDAAPAGDDGGSGDDDSSTGTDSGAAGTPVIAVLKIGDGVAGLPSATTTNLATIEFRDVNGLVASSYPLPSGTPSTGTPSFTVAESALEGEMSLSPDGHYIFVPGYDLAAGVDTSTSTATRTIARISSTGAYDLTTSLGTTFSAGYAHGAGGSGTTLWAAGTGGVFTTTFGSTAAATNILVSTSTYHSVSVQNGQLYATSSSGVSQLGTGLPTTLATATPTVITPGFVGSTNGATTFLAVGSSATTVDTLYVAAPSESAGIQKWTLTGTTWALDYTIGVGTIGCLAVTGSIDTTFTTVTLYALSAGTQNGIYTFSDTRTTTTNTSSPKATALGPSGKDQGLAPTNTAFRGITLVPHS